MLSVSKLSLALLILTSLFLIATGVDRLVELPRFLRPILPLATVVVPGIVIVSLFLALRRSRKADELAGEIDAAVEGSRDAVRTALNLREREDSTSGSVHPFMLDRVLSDAERVSEEAKPEEVVGWGNTSRVAVALVVLILVIGGLLSWNAMKMPLLLKRFINPLGNYPRPSLTEIRVEGSLERKVTQGNDLTIESLLAGRIPAEGQCSAHVVDGKSERLITMTPRPGNRFDTVFKTVEQPFSFYLTAGDGRTALYRVGVEPRPMIRSAQVHYEYPRYTSLKPVSETVKNREIKGLEGTRVRIDFEVSLPVKDATAEFPDRKSKVRWDETRTKGSVQFTIERDCPLFLRLVADSGTDNNSDPPFRVKMEPDQPPTISLSGLNEGAVFYRNDVLQLSYSGSDDFGVTDLYLRFSKGGGRGGEQRRSVEMEKANAKQFQGQFAVPIEAMTAEDDGRIEIELVATDGKGQESATPRAVLQIISDTPDRLLTELVFFHEKYLDLLSKSATALSAQASRLTIVIDGLDANTPLKDARLQMVQEVRNNLGRVTFPDVFTYLIYERQFPYTEYPYHSLRKAEDCMTLPVSLIEGDVYMERLSRLVEDKNPKDGLVQLKALAEAQAAEAQLLQQALSDNLHETQLRLISVLAELYVQDAAEGTKATQPDAALLIAQKQDERVKQLLALTEKVLTRVVDEKTKQSLQAFRTEAALPATERAEKLPVSLKQLAETLFAGTELDGHLGASLENYYRTYPLARRFADAEKNGTLDRLQSSLQLLMRLRQDDDVLNDADLFLTARLHEAMTTGNAARRASAVAAVARLTPWSVRYGLLDRVRTLQSSLQNIDRDRDLGRVQIGSPTFNRRWQDARELFLSIVRDQRAGYFAPIAAEVDTDIAGLAKLAPAFRPWDSKAAFSSPDFAAAMKSVATGLQAMIVKLAPVVDRETKEMLPETAEMLRDMAAHIASLKPALAAERESIAKEIANPRKPEGYYKDYGPPYPARVNFDRVFSRSMTSHSIAFSKVLDLRERLALAAPTPETIADLTAMNLMFEYLVHVDEEAYSRTYKMHVDNQYIPSHLYPAYLNDIAKFYSEFEPTTVELATWLQRIIESKGTQLLTDAAFNDLLKRSKNQSRHTAAVKTLTEHTEFLQKLQQARNDADRRAYLVSVSQEPGRSLAYWEELYLAAQRAHDLIDKSTKDTTAEKWKGLNAETAVTLKASAASIRAMLPDIKSGNDDAKQLNDVLTRLDDVAAKATEANVGTMKPDTKQLVFADLNDCRDRLQSSLQSMQGLLTVPVIQTRTRSETQAIKRVDMFYVLSRIIRNESRWMQRVADADRRVWTGRVQLMEPQAGARPTQDDVAWLVSREQVSRRKSAGALTQSSRGLNLDAGGGRTVPPRMPAYLFEELERAMKKPYPTQFKDPSLEYMSTLMKDAR